MLVVTGITMLELGPVSWTFPVEDSVRVFTTCTLLLSAILTTACGAAPAGDAAGTTSEAMRFPEASGTLVIRVVAYRRP